MSISTTLLDKAKLFATDILENQLSEDLTYHNLAHTKIVVDAVKIIGTSENLNEEEFNTLQIAAWFHDTGFRDAYEGHEKKSCLVAEEFLKDQGQSQELIEKVCDCIKATAADAQPQNKLERVICDADMYHISLDNYEEFTERLRNEWKKVLAKNYSDLEWIRLNMDFITSQKFHTEFGKRVLGEASTHLLASFQKRAKKIQSKADLKLMQELGVTPDELKSLKKSLKKNEGKPERGIETMFRLTSKNHLSLSAMADSKANIVISVNSIIISIIIGSIMQKLDNNAHLIIPTVILLTVNLLSIVFSILSLRPNVTKGLFTKEDIENHKTNLLFFGNFHKVKREDYHWGMNRLMENGKFLYSSLIDDIYFLGVVLARKYRLLRTSYNVFMVGIIVAVVAFFISNFFAEPKTY